MCLITKQPKVLIPRFTKILAMERGTISIFYNVSEGAEYNGKGRSNDGEVGDPGCNKWARLHSNQGGWAGAPEKVILQETCTSAYGSSQWIKVQVGVGGLGEWVGRSANVFGRVRATETDAIKGQSIAPPTHCCSQ